MHGDITGEVINAFFEVFEGLGSGFLEAVYANALAVELSARGLRVARERSFRVHWKGVDVGFYRADLIVDDKVLVELKAGAAPDPSAEAQLLNYLKASGIRVGLLLNFGRRPSFLRRVV